MGDSPDVRFKMSHEQRWIFDQLSHMIQGLGKQGYISSRLPGLGAPLAPEIPAAPMPTEGWWSGLDPNIKAGIREPYVEQSNQLMEMLGSKGMTGSQASPYSGSAATGAAEFWGDVTPKLAAQGWGMTSPGMWADWQSEKERLLSDYTTQKQVWGMPFEMLGMTQSTMPYPVVSGGGPSLLGSLGSGAGGAMAGGAALGPWGAAGGGLMGLMGGK